MTVSAATRNLEGRLDSLPAGVSSLIGGSSRVATAYAPTEDSISSALGIFNNMLLESWSHLDAKIVECQEFQQSSKKRGEQVATDLARLADGVAELKGARNNAVSQIQEIEEEFNEVTRRRKEETALYETQMVGLHHERQLRSDDRDVALLIAGVTRCGGTGLLQLGNSPHPAAVLAQKTRLCKADDTGELYLGFEDGATRDETLQKMSPHMAGVIHQLLHKGAGHRHQRRAHGGAMLLQKMASHRSLDLEDDGEEPEAAAEDVLNGTNGTLNFTEILTTTMTPIEVALSPPEELGKKCSLGDVSCGPLHENAVAMVGEAQDAMDDLQFDIAKAEEEYNSMMEDFNLQLKLLTESKKEYNAQLSGATSKMNGIEDQRKNMQREYRELQDMADTHSEQCEKEISAILYTEMCSLRTVRGAIVSHSGSITAEDIVDCEVSDWIPGECSKSCDNDCPGGPGSPPCGGFQQLTRNVLQDPNEHGTHCPALAFRSSCNQVQCPVDCEVSYWSSFSACSKDCDGGVRQRTRSILTQPRNGGETCDSVTETQSCNTGSCDKDCALRPWTAWGGCSQACGGGVKERFKRVLARAKGGGGKCPGRRSDLRYELAHCNDMACNGDEICIAKMDLVIVVDSGGSMVDTDFTVVKDFVAQLVARYRGEAYGGEAMRIGVVQFGNGDIGDDGTITAAHEVTTLSSDLAAVATAVQGMSPLQGFPNVAQSLNLAEKIFASHARPRVESRVLFITDSKPTYQRQALDKIQELWDKSISTFVVSLSRFKHGENAKAVKKLASLPRVANFLHIPGIQSLQNNMTDHVQSVVAKSCPKTESPALTGEESTRVGFGLVVEDKACGDPSARTLLGRADDMGPEECFRLARAAPAPAAFFGVGNGPRRGWCWAEGAATDAACGAGFQPSFSDFYEVTS